jgi:hypothetical protein
MEWILIGVLLASVLAMEFNFRKWDKRLSHKEIVDAPKKQKRTG